MLWSARVCTLALLLSAAWAWPRPVEAQIRRCVLPNGDTVYTDRGCDTVGGVDRLARAPAAASAANNAKGGYRGGCSRNVQDLVFQITAAIDAHDGNRLAGVYHWAGMSGSTGYSVLERLDRIAQRPLVDIVPVMAAAPAPEPVAAPSEPLAAAADASAEPRTSGDASAPPDPNYYPQTSIRRTPVALRVEQTLANGSTPSHTVFGLVRHFGCWWIKG